VEIVDQATEALGKGLRVFRLGKAEYHEVAVIATQRVRYPTSFTVNWQVRRRSVMDYEIVFGDGFVQYEWETEAKGWFEARVKVSGSEVTILFYDPVRLAQVVQDALDQAGLFFEKMSS
jgi:hypothetical protein